MTVSPDVLPRRAYVGLTLASAPSESAGWRGLLVRGVAPGSAAERAGVRAGDWLTHLDLNPAHDRVEVRRLLRALRPGDPLLLDVVRGGQALRLTSELIEYPVERHAGATTLLGQARVDGHWLRSIAVVPNTPGPHPVVYYLPGAHWASEEYPLEPWHPVPALASALASIGVVMLRVERSGLGDSQGPPCTRTDFRTELAGYQAGIDALGAAPYADPERTFLFGHSLGAMVAPLLARHLERTRGGGPRGVVTFGASAIPISRALVGAIERHAELDAVLSASPRERAERRARTDKLVELVTLVTSGETPERIFRARPDLERVAPPHMMGDQAYHRIATFYHQLEREDLWGAWAAVRCPVLAIHGERDWISTAEDSRAIASAVGGHGEHLELPGVDHQLSDAAANQRARLAPALRDAVLAWLKARI